MRAVVATLVAIVLGVGLAAPARAELRTGSHGNPFAAVEPVGSPTRPVFDSVQLRYDSTAGSLEATIRFTTGLADPAMTSALRPWHYELTLGDYMGTICSGDLQTWLHINGGLGEAPPPRLTDSNLFSPGLNLEVAQAFSPDRSALTLSVTAPGLVGRNLICADVDVSRDDPGFESTSGSRAFLLDGFSRLDGEIAREAADTITDDIEFLDRDWGRANRSRRALFPKVDCRALYRDTVQCSAAATLKSVAGRPRVRLHGDLVFPQPFVSASLGHPKWMISIRGDVRWQRCPHAIDPPKRLIGRRCMIKVRWRGTKDLSSAVLTRRAS